jgi:hypothetical protein
MNRLNETVLPETLSIQFCHVGRIFRLLVFDVIDLIIQTSKRQRHLRCLFHHGDKLQKYVRVVKVSLASPTSPSKIQHGVRIACGIFTNIRPQVDHLCNETWQ